MDMTQIVNAGKVNIKMSVPMHHAMVWLSVNLMMILALYSQGGNTQ